MPQKWSLWEADDASDTALLTFRPLNRVGSRGSNPRMPWHADRHFLQNACSVKSSVRPMARISSKTGSKLIWRLVPRLLGLGHMGTDVPTYMRSAVALCRLPFLSFLLFTMC